MYKRFKEAYKMILKFPFKSISTDISDETQYFNKGAHVCALAVKLLLSPGFFMRLTGLFFLTHYIDQRIFNPNSKGSLKAGTEYVFSLPIPYL